jgi:Protein of unknown function (DUF998)
MEAPQARAFGKAAVASTLLFTAIVLFMHIAQPELSALDMAVSYYMNGRLGWVLGLGLVALGIGSLGLATALRGLLAGRRATVGLWLLLVWAVACTVGGIFPPDPPGHWDEPATAPGTIHGVAGILAFLALSPATWLLSRSIGSSRPRTEAARALGILSVLSVIALITFFVCLAPVFANRPPYALGLVERVLLTVDVSWLALAALMVAQGRILSR